MNEATPWPKLPDPKDMAETQPMTTRREIGDFKTFVFPVIRGDPAKSREQAERTKRKHEAEREADLAACRGLRCPGCCGTVYANSFDAFDYGPDCRRDAYRSFVCGESTFKIGPHGSLAYIELKDPRPLQEALDTEFAKRQADRQEELEEFKASGAESITYTRGCGTIVSGYIPKGPLPATTHGVDCKCEKPKVQP